MTAPVWTSEQAGEVREYDSGKQFNMQVCSDLEKYK